MAYEIGIRGVIVDDSDKWIYDWFGEQCICPGDVRKILEEAKGQPVDVFINSIGGSVFSGSEIYTLLMAYNGDVNIRIDGVAASAASVVAMAGHTSMSPTSQMMVHNVWSSAQGDYRDMDKTSERLQKANQTVASAYMIKSGMSMEEALAMMDAETWLTAAEAMAKGLIDTILFEDEAEKALFNTTGFAHHMKHTMQNMYAALPRINKQMLLDAYHSKHDDTANQEDDKEKMKALAEARRKFLNLRSM